jgi:hypothetical protein
MTRSIRRWIGVVAICLVILVLPLAGGAQRAAHETTDPGLSLRWPSSVRSDKDCVDFRSQARAQRFFIGHGGPERDRHRLDTVRTGERDGRACEAFDYRSSR